MKIYQVWSKRRDEEEILETSRTSLRAAEDDVKLLKDICYKNAYVVAANHGRA